MPIQKLHFVVLLCLFAFHIQSKAQVIAGKIINEQNEPIPYATIYITETKEGTISNTEGNFSLSLEKGIYHFTIRSLGYQPVEKGIRLNSDSLRLDIKMLRQEFEIKEVKVFPGKEDPAWFIIRKAIANASRFREKIKHYEADLYIKSNFTVTNVPKIYQNKMEVNGKKLKDALAENVTYVIESQNKITFEYPQNYKQEVVSKKSSLTGFDEPPVMGLLTANFYEERPNQVISPLSPIALKHYNYRYEGFITTGNTDIFKIKVIPKRKSDELVSGYIYIVDRLWCIYNVDFNARIEFFEYRINQQYQNLGSENWMPVSHLIEGSFSLLGLKGRFYYGASLKYQNILENNELKAASAPTTEEGKVEKPNSKKDEFRKEVARINEKEELTNQDVKNMARLNRKILKEQYKDSTLSVQDHNNYTIDERKDSVRADTFIWDTVRAIPLTPAELRSYQLSDSLMAVREAGTDSIPGKKTKKEKTFFAKIISGNSDFCKDSIVSLGYKGLISADNFDFNTVDGYKYKQSFNLTFNPDTGKRITFNPEIGYAFNRKAVFWRVESRFDNLWIKHNQLSVDFGKESCDFKPSGLGINPALNSISSWIFAQNYMKLYETTFLKISFNQRLAKKINIAPLVEYNHFSPLENHVSYQLSDKKEFSPNIPKGFSENNKSLAAQKSTVFGVVANYRIYLQKPWLEKSNFLFMNDFYSFQLYYKQGVKNVFSSVSDFSQIDFRFQQQANISPSAGIDWKINAGHFFQSRQIHFSQFKHFKTDEIPVSFGSFTHTFQLLNDYEFSTGKSYLTVGAEYRSEYLLLRYLSILNKRTWSESIHFNYLSTTALKNYWETGYSLNNLFFLGNVGIFAGFEEERFKYAGFKVSVAGF